MKRRKKRRKPAKDISATEIARRGIIRIPKEIIYRVYEGSGVTLPRSHRAIGIDFDRVRHFAADGICLIHNTNARMPNLFERVAHNSVAGVSQTRIFPAQHDSDLGGERLLGAVDATDVRHPDTDRDLSRTGISVRSIDQSGRFRTEREPDRQRKNHKQRKTDSLHDIATGKRPDSVLEFVQLLELPADYIAHRDLN